MLGCNLIKAGKLIIASLSEREIQLFYSFMFLEVYKGTRQKQLSGFCPLRGGGEYHPFPLKTGLSGPKTLLLPTFGLFGPF